MLVLIGKTTSGKTTVRDKLVKKHGWKEIVTYTTRPMRKGEKQDITYHFISMEEFKEKINNGFFAEWKSYITNEGIWYYGTAKEDIEKADDNTVIILTPDGVRDILSTGLDVSIIYIYSNITTIYKRLNMRGDKRDEIERRVAADNIDFKGAELLADKIIYNNDGADIDTVTEDIISCYERIKKGKQ